MMERERQRAVASVEDEEPVEKQETRLSIMLRRGLVAGKRGGLCTPSPAWKLEEDVGELAEAVVGAVERPPEAACKRQSLSVRKLGANLWDLHDLLPLEGIKRRVGPHRHRDGRGGAGLLHPVEADEVIHHNPAVSSVSSLVLKGGIGDAAHNLKTSTELLKVLNQIWSLEEKHASNVYVIKSLEVELEHARKFIQELMLGKKEHRCEMDELMKQVTEGKVRKKKEKDRIKAAVQSIREELDVEKRLRRLSETLHRKLGKELNDTKAALFKASKDLENERRSNGLLQELCDEFARGIGRYGKEMREFKKYMDNCEHTDDLVLRVSEIWLDLRLQSQMVESCGKKPEKVAVISRLKEEIISFLQARRANSINCDSEQYHHQNLRRQSLESLHLNETISAPHVIDDNDSMESDLHCFELNMDKTKEGIPDQLKSNCEINSISLECGRKSSSARKIVGARRTKQGFGRQLEGKKLDNIMNSPTDAYCDETAIFQKWTNSTYAGDCQRNVCGMSGSNLLTHYASKNSSKSSSASKVHDLNYQEEINQNKFLGRENFFATLSPAQEWNYRTAAVDSEISECSSKLPQDLKENTLKAKLLEARLEGRHARLRVLKGT